MCCDGGRRSRIDGVSSDSLRLHAIDASTKDAARYRVDEQRHEGEARGLRFFVGRLRLNRRRAHLRRHDVVQPLQAQVRGLVALRGKMDRRYDSVPLIEQGEVTLRATRAVEELRMPISTIPELSGPSLRGKT